MPRLRQFGTKARRESRGSEPMQGFISRGSEQDQGCLCGVMACERDILPQRLRAGITRFFEKHLIWLQRVIEAGIENGTIRPGIDPAAQQS